MRDLQQRVSAEERTLFMPLEYEDRQDGQPEGDVLFNMKGHAAVFDQLSEDLGGFRERIMRGAFRKALAANTTVKALWDHDSRLVLGSTSAKTLDLREDPRGLHSYTQVAPTSYARDLQILLKRGDINQMSFGFTVEEDRWLVRKADPENDQPKEVIREIVSIKRLFDVSAVAYPAYPQTDVAARSAGDLLLVRGLVRPQGRGVEPGTPNLGAVLRDLGLEGATITININGSRTEELSGERDEPIVDGPAPAEEESVRTNRSARLAKRLAEA